MARGKGATSARKVAPKKAKPSATAKFFTRLGRRGWRQSGYDTFAYSSTFFRRWLASQLGARPRTMLSIGCGSGELEQHLAELGHETVGLDVAHSLLQRARRKGLDLLVQADAARLPFAGAQFDRVLILETIGYFDLKPVIAEARRVLRNRGQLVITSYGPGASVHELYRLWSMAEMEARLRAAGFRIAVRRFLAVRRQRIDDAPSPEQANLFYLVAAPAHRRPETRARPRSARRRRRSSLRAEEA
jgi:ubiquinone/menaquinone biosynthesis C-methylase UbiE